MKRKLICLFLALICLLPLTSRASAYSSFEDYLRSTGRMEHINYTRVRQDTRERYRISFNIGSLSFRGTLKKGYRMDDETTDKYIRQVLVEQGISARQLFLREVQIMKAKELDPAFKPTYWLEMIGQLLHGDKIISAFSADGSGTKFINDQIISEGISVPVGIVISEIGLGPVGSFIVNGLTNCAEPTAKEVLKALKNSEIKQKAVEAEAVLNMFYGRLNTLLAEEAAKRDDTTWQLSGSWKRNIERELFGAPVMQKWSFRCDFKKEENTKSAEGWYTGSVFIDVTHDMTKFDGRFLWDVANNLSMLPDVRREAVGQSFYDCWKRSSRLEKHFLGEKVRVYLPDGISEAENGAVLAGIDLGELKTREDFWSMHPVWIVPDGIMPFIDEQGRYSFPYTEGQVGTVCYLMGEMWDGMSPQIYMMASTAKMENTVDAPNYHTSWEQSITGGGAVLRKNHDIFKELENGRIEIKAGWEEN